MRIDLKRKPWAQKFMVIALAVAVCAISIFYGRSALEVNAESTYTQITNSANSITEMTVDGQEKNRVSTGPHVFAAATASGTWGTCPWSLSSDGVLTIGAGTGRNSSGYGSAPWYSQGASIKSVKLTGKVKLPKSVQYLFSGCSNLTTFDASNLDTSAVTNMNNMFSYCDNLTTLDASNWDTRAVTNMSYMFYSCSKLTTLDASNWNTGAVTNMSHMFKCSKLTTLDVSNWDTSAVTNMSHMFKCSKLTTLDVSNWDTSAVTNMSDMFDGCSKLTPLNVSNWATGKVTSMSYMFYNCGSLTQLDVSNWNTSAVTNMSSMFYYCSGLTTLNVSSWDTSKVTDMSHLFDSSGLRKIKIGSGFANSAKSTNVFPTPSKTISGKDSSGAWGLGSETAAKQYTATELATLGQMAGALTGTWYAQSNALTFKSWNTKPDGSGTTYKLGDALPDANLDLYAQWG